MLIQLLGARDLLMREARTVRQALRSAALLLTFLGVQTAEGRAQTASILQNAAFQA